MTRGLLRRTIKSLVAKYNEEHMLMKTTEANQMKMDIASLESFMKTISDELVGCYCQNEDKTFVLKNTYDGDKLVTSECVGWYCGEPSDTKNEIFSRGEFLAKYDS